MPVGFYGRVFYDTSPIGSLQKKERLKYRKVSKAVVWRVILGAPWQQIFTTQVKQVLLFLIYQKRIRTQIGSVCHEYEKQSRNYYGRNFRHW